MPNKFGTAHTLMRALSFAVPLAFFQPVHAGPKWKKITSGAGSSLQGGFMEFINDGTWTVPAGITRIQVIVIGAGGGGRLNTNVGGGGGGGSCIKRSSTVLASADGGAGAGTATVAQPGSRTSVSLTVTPGETLNVFIGGGGGAGDAVAGGNATTSSGAAGGNNGGQGGTNTAGGAFGGGLAGGGGGGSGGVGGVARSVSAGSSSVGAWASRLAYDATNGSYFTAEPGEPGRNMMPTGGGPGVIYISW